MLTYREPAITTLSKLITVTPNTDSVSWGQRQVLGMGVSPHSPLQGEKVKFCIIQVTCILTEGIGFSSRITHIHLLSFARV